MIHITLDPLQKQTRLLHLHPGEREDKVTCHFSIVSLNDHDKEYEALSYVWGARNQDQFVFVDETPMSVTDNLWHALAGLRYLDRDRILWVDALCINQSDDDEGSYQVSQMKLIYSRASSVEIWLGESYEHIDVAFKLITEVATGLTTKGNITSYSYLADAFPPDYDSGTIDQELLDNDAREAVTLLTAITEFAKMSWFERTWTVQEFFLAKKSAFNWGTYTLDGTIFVQFLYHPSKHNESCCEVDLPHGLQIRLSELFPSTFAILSLKAIRMDFLICVRGFRFRKATNPRDKIYGVLGLDVDDTSNLVQTDYTLAVEEVYETFVHSLLNHTKNLNVLSHLRTDQQTNLKLPSFVPDWTLDLNDLGDLDLSAWTSRWHALEFYNAASGTQVEFNSRPGILALRGVVVDTVKTTAVNTIDSIQQADARSSASNNFIDELQRTAAVPSLDEDDGLIKRQAFWLAMIAECQPHLGAMPNQFDEAQSAHKMSEFYERLSDIDMDLYEGYEQLLRTVKDKVSLGNQVPQAFFLIDVALAAAHEGRKFMMTQEGRMGLVPTHAREGDVVAVLTGGHVPIILRPKEGHYTVVGDAYVQGIMDGEAMPASEKLEYIELR
jgi:hypothetical protein